MKFLRVAASIGLLFAGIGSAVAGPLDFSTGSYSISGIGAEFDTIYDSFTLSGLSGVVNATPGTTTSVGIATYAFTVGPNCYSCSLTPSGFTTGFTATIDNQTQQILLPWSWSSTGPVDTLSVSNAAPVRFDLGADALTLTGLSLGSLSSGGGTLSGEIYANFNFEPVTSRQSLGDVSNVPEPGTMAIFSAGLAGFGLFVFRRRRSAAATRSKHLPAA